MSLSPRHRIPNANSPELLARLLELVGQGVRSHRGLTEALGMGPRTVRYYVQAALWLGFVEDDDEVSLTSDGVDFVYAGSARPRVYARVVRKHPFVRELLSRSVEDVPELDEVVRLVGREEPELSASTVRRRASSVRSLISPALGMRARRSDSDRQLGLPFAVAPPTLVAARASLPREGGEDYDPDVYRFVFSSLVDYGELGLTRVRALLDDAGAEASQLGGYLDLAAKRGDAVQEGERLVIQPCAIRRRDLADTTSSILLSDAGYRRWLLARIADPLAAPPPQVQRYRAWDRRLFGAELAPAQVEKELEKVLMDRSVNSFPVALPSEERLPIAEGFFLDRWEQPGLAITLPPSLIQLSGGVSLVNQLLRKARLGRPVALPDLADGVRHVHGGLLAPGETLPRSVPDTRSLRVRLLSASPYVAMIAALLLLHRRSALPVSVMHWHGNWVVRRGRRSLGGVLRVLDAFSLAQQWLPCRRRTGGLDMDRLLDVLETVGVMTHTGARAVLAEQFFGQLRREAEEMELAERLDPLVERMANWIAEVEPVEDL